MEFLTRDEVLGILKMARSSLYVLMDEDGFPRPRKFRTSNRWLKSEVEAWLKDKAESHVR